MIFNAKKSILAKTLVAALGLSVTLASCAPALSGDSGAAGNETSGAVVSSAPAKIEFVKKETRFAKDDSTRVLVEAEINADDIDHYFRHGDHWHVFTKDGVEHLTYVNPETMGKEQPLEFVSVVSLEDLKSKNIVAIKVHEDHYHVYDSDGQEYLTYDNPSALFPNIKVETYTGTHGDGGKKSNAKNSGSKTLSKAFGSKVVSARVKATKSGSSVGSSKTKLGQNGRRYSASVAKNADANQKSGSDVSSVTTGHKAKSGSTASNGGMEVVKILQHGDHYHVYTADGQEFITYTNPSSQYPNASFGQYVGSHGDLGGGQKPSKPGTPAKPTKPSKPATPAKPSKPATPAKPSKPNTDKPGHNNSSSENEVIPGNNSGNATKPVTPDTPINPDTPTKPNSGHQGLLAVINDEAKLKTLDVKKILKHLDHYHLYTTDGTEIITYNEIVSDLYPGVEVGEYDEGEITFQTDVAPNVESIAQRGKSYVVKWLHKDHYHEDAVGIVPYLENVFVDAPKGYDFSGKKEFNSKVANVRFFLDGDKVFVVSTGTDLANDGSLFTKATKNGDLVTVEYKGETFTISELEYNLAVKEQRFEPTRKDIFDNTQGRSKMILETGTSSNSNAFSISDNKIYTTVANGLYLLPNYYEMGQDGNGTDYTEADPNFDHFAWFVARPGASDFTEIAVASEYELTQEDLELTDSDDGTLIKVAALDKNGAILAQAVYTVALNQTPVAPANGTLSAKEAEVLPNIKYLIYKGDTLTIQWWHVNHWHYEPADWYPGIKFVKAPADFVPDEDNKITNKLDDGREYYRGEDAIYYLEIGAEGVAKPGTQVEPLAPKPLNPNAGAEGLDVDSDAETDGDADVSADVDADEDVASADQPELGDTAAEDQPETGKSGLPTSLEEVLANLKLIKQP